MDVCRRDDEVDRIKHDIREGAEEQIRREPDKVRPLMRLLAVSRSLERIANCATNIAEDVIYMSDGRIIRHNKLGLLSLHPTGRSPLCRLGDCESAGHRLCLPLLPKHQTNDPRGGAAVAVGIVVDLVQRIRRPVG